MPHSWLLSRCKTRDSCPGSESSAGRWRHSLRQDGGGGLVGGGRCVGDVTHSRAGRRLSAVVVYPWEEVAAARPSWSALARCFLAPQNLWRRRAVVFFFLLLPPSLPMVGYMYLALSRVQRPRTNTHEILFNPLPSPPQSLTWRPSIFPQGCHHQSASIQHFFMACSVNAPCTPLCRCAPQATGLGFLPFFLGRKLGTCVWEGEHGDRAAVGMRGTRQAGGRGRLMGTQAAVDRRRRSHARARFWAEEGERQDRHTLPFRR